MEDLAAAFDQLDLDGDGWVSAGELATRQVLRQPWPQQLLAPGAALAARGAQFRSQLQPADLGRLDAAQALFQASLWVPALLYYGCRLSDSPPRFPCTISWSIRRGPPRWAQHALWLAGWYQAAAAVLPQRDAFGTCFVLSMVATGVVGVMLCPVGVSPAFDVVHYAASALYMVDHVVLLAFFGVTTFYCLGFFGSLVLFFAATSRLDTVHTAIGVEFPPGLTMDGRAKIEAALSGPARATLRRAELVQMAFEYLLFFTFISGMCSGLPPTSGDGAVL
eukprot:SAG22_NODE_4787_length_1164_cov_1.140845_1_plen_278_part_00